MANNSKERTNISIFLETYDMLVQAKLQAQARLGKELTWDDFFKEILKEG